WRQLRDDILGEAVVFAYRGGPPGKPEQEEGLVLGRARDPGRLADLIERLNQGQKAGGDLKALAEREDDRLQYLRRVEQKEQNFYYLRGPVLVFSGQEALLRRAVDQERKAPAGRESPLGRRRRELGADRALVALLLNPRALDAAMEAQLAKAK